MNERDIIACLHRQNGEGRPDLLCGIGDDCAVIEKNAQRSYLVTMDTLVESVHFDLRWHPPEKLGRKAVAVNVSDIAAMGGEPVFVFLSLGLPQGFDPSWMNSFSEGIAGACREYDCILAGGDTVRSPKGVQITITVIGEVAADQVVYRRGALTGDMIWVSGILGMAAAGLEVCRSGMGVDGTSLLRPLSRRISIPAPGLVWGACWRKAGAYML
jgi:thiamine-monophosphate kinase